LWGTHSASVEKNVLEQLAVLSRAWAKRKGQGAWGARGPGIEKLRLLGTIRTVGYLAKARRQQVGENAILGPFG